MEESLKYFEPIEPLRIISVVYFLSKSRNTLNFLVNLNVAGAKWIEWVLSDECELESDYGMFVLPNAPVGSSCDTLMALTSADIDSYISQIPVNVDKFNEILQAEKLLLITSFEVNYFEADETAGADGFRYMELKIILKTDGEQEPVHVLSVVMFNGRKYARHNVFLEFGNSELFAGSV
jgi:hypothetical protein